MIQTKFIHLYSNRATYPLWFTGCWASEEVTPTAIYCRDTYWQPAPRPTGLEHIKI